MLLLDAGAGKTFFILGRTLMPVSKALAVAESVPCRMAAHDHAAARSNNFF